MFAQVSNRRAYSALNSVADAIMAENGIPAVDTWALSLFPGDALHTDNVHMHGKHDLFYATAMGAALSYLLAAEADAALPGNATAGGAADGAGDVHAEAGRRWAEAAAGGNGAAEAVASSKPPQPARGPVGHPPRKTLPHRIKHSKLVDRRQQVGRPIRRPIRSRKAAAAG